MRQSYPGVRTLSVHDDMQHGLTFQKASAPFEMSVLPYSAYELENAMHLDELQVFATHGSESLQSDWVSAAMIPGVHRCMRSTESMQISR